MKPELIVKEFDKITNKGNENLNGDNVHKIEEEHYKLLKEFCALETEDTSKFSEIKFVPNSQNTYVKFKNHVGIIQLENNFRIQILPKIDIVNNNIDNSLKILIEMIKIMNNPSCVLPKANLQIDSVDILEEYINMYLNEVEILVNKGLKSSYITKEENLKYYKGKLLVNQNIKYNFANKSKFYVRYKEFCLNIPENKIIKTTLLKLLKISQDIKNIQLINKLMTYFDEVDVSFNYSADFNQIVIDRIKEEYTKLINWSKVFLQDKSFISNPGEHSAISLLYPMEKLFENYVYHNMRKFWSIDGYIVRGQVKSKHLINQFKEESCNIFALKPDIKVQTPNNKTIILDTKWKELCNEPKKYDISESDMYQMYVYGKKYNAEHIWLLYPKIEKPGNKDNIYYKTDDNINIHVFFIDLENIEDSLKELKQQVENI